jgi:hypothetical protein
VSFFQGEQELSLPQDEEGITKLLDSSSTLKADFEAAAPSDTSDREEWLRQQYHDDFCDLGLYGPEHGDDLRIDLTITTPRTHARLHAHERGDPCLTS